MRKRPPSSRSINAPNAAGPSGARRVAIVACGALAHEISTIIKQQNLGHIQVKYLPAKLHTTPGKIPEAVADALATVADQADELFVAYADCGTAGKLDVILEQFGATRLEGAHCYQFFAGNSQFENLQDAEPGTFYLTDYLARQFDSLVYKPLGLDRHPELLQAYFGNYTRLVYLSQIFDARLEQKARDAAKRLGLNFQHIHTGYGALEPALTTLTSAEATSQIPVSHPAFEEAR